MNNAQLIYKLKEWQEDLRKHLKTMKKTERINACLVLSELEDRIEILIKEVKK